METMGFGRVFVYVTGVILIWKAAKYACYAGFVVVSCIACGVEETKARIKSVA